MRRRASKQSGFTLIEMMVAVGIVALLVTIAIPMTTRITRDQRLRGAARHFVGHYKQIQQTTATGTDMSAFGIGFGSGSGMGGPPVTPRARFGGVIINSNGYSTFVDADDQPYSGNEATIKFVQFDEGNTGDALEIIAPAPGTIIQFRSNGMMLNGQPVQITLRDPITGSIRNIDINIAGGIRIQQ